MIAGKMKRIGSTFHSRATLLVTWAVACVAASCGGQKAQEQPAFAPENLTDARDHQIQPGAGARGVVPRTDDNAPRQPKFCIITHFTDEIRHYADITTANHGRYAQRHNYLYHVFEGHLSGQRFLMPTSDDHIKRYGIYWQSFVAIDLALSWTQPDEQKRLCDWVLWIDADAIFTDMDTSIEQMLALWQHQEGFDVNDKDFLLSREQVGGAAIVNAGVMLIRNSPGGRDVIVGVEARFDAVKDTWWADQRAIHDHVFAAQGGGWSADDLEASMAHVRAEVQILPQRAMNSFCDCPDCMLGPGQHSKDWRWRAGDFIAHFAGWKQQERLQTMIRMATSDRLFR